MVAAVGVAQILRLPVRPHTDQGGPYLSASLFDDRQRFGHLRRRHNARFRFHQARPHDARLHDARFFCGDGRGAVAEIGLVIEMDRRDDRQLGLNDVCRVQSAAEADFHHAPLNPCLAKSAKSRGGHRLEKRGVAVRSEFLREAVVGSTNLVDGRGEIRVANLLAVQPDALVETHQVGRGEESGGVSGGPQAGLDHGGGRAFAVGAGDVDDAEALLGIP